MNRIEVLWLDDDLSNDAWAAEHIALFKRYNFRIIPCRSVAEAMDRIEQRTTNNLLLDVAMPNNPKEGLILLDYIKKSHPEMRVVVFTNYPHHEDAIRAIKAAAVDYLTKPIPSQVSDQKHFFIRLRRAFGTDDLLPEADKKTVFIVHGTNHKVRNQIDLFLTKELNLRTVVMDEHAHSGRTLPEKFETISDSCDFAVIILTADDSVVLEDTNVRVKRGRQNVILEIGYFWGALGRRGKLALLVENDPSLDLPSDVHGLGWIPITSDLAETKLRLRKELEASGIL